ncbi:MAG: hypothetical protein FWD61_11105 [Phycisphaerales bacterium]|nr:hypothetical protein [Phycisphaerales bacterium]
MIIAGIDEAGYGPLLGPLVVSATAFELGGVPLPVDAEEIPDLWHMLRVAVSKKAPAKKGRVLVADSKVVNHLTDGTKLLERGVLAFLRCYGRGGGGTGVDGAAWNGLTANRLMAIFSCTNHELAAHPWYSPDHLTIPWLAEAGDLGIAANMLSDAMEKAGVKTVCMRTAVVSEKAFNRLVDGTHNKASSLVSITLSHLYHLHMTFGHQGLLVGVDKQGGRDHYTQLLLRSFPEAELKVMQESEAVSTYLLTEAAGRGGCSSPGRRTLICFREKGESAFFPTALASMLCKYLRELCMHNFNMWWCEQIMGLRPTAGYHSDGIRWLSDVEPHLERLGIRREMLVRSR